MKNQRRDDISDETFRGGATCPKNQHMNIITVTHGALYGSGIISSINPTMRMRSERFVEY